MDAPRTYRLLDCGFGRRLEALGALVIDRPAQTADGPRHAPAQWTDAISYRSGRGWAAIDGRRPEHDAAQVEFDGIVMTAQLGSGGQIGLFPEHAANAGWLRDAIRSRSAEAPDGGPEVLNLFAHTGLLSLIAAAAGARVAHVDASRPAVQTARLNAERSGLASKPVRWIVDDAVAFVKREGRRDRRYAGFIIDPPSYGHGARSEHGRGWQFETGIDDLLDACRAIAGTDAFWILSTHTPAWDPDRLANTLERHVSEARDHAQPRELEIVAESGAILRLGAAAFLDPWRSTTR